MKTRLRGITGAVMRAFGHQVSCPSHASGASINFLQNGGFESLKTPPSTTPPGFNQLTNNVPFWNTTASDNKIEIWSTGYSSSSNGPVYTYPVSDGFYPNGGTFFAELNATQISTLYQDVTASATGLISYSFLHRGRGRTDTMLLRVEAFLGGKWVSVYEQQYSTGPDQWVQYQGRDIGLVKAGTALRFSYVSISGSTTSIGNFLDNAAFGILEFPPDPPVTPTTPVTPSTPSTPGTPPAVVVTVPPDPVAPSGPSREAIIRLRNRLVSALVDDGLAFNAGVADTNFLMFRQTGGLLMQQFYSLRTARQVRGEEAPAPVPLVVDEKSVREPKDGPGGDGGRNVASEAAAELSRPGRGRTNVWTVATGIYADQKTVNDIPSSFSQSGNFMVGADYGLTRDLRLGMFAGYILNEQKFRQTGGGNVSTNGLTYGGYLTYARSEGGFYFDIAAGGGGFSSRVSRPVNFFNINLESATSVQSSTAFFGMLDGGYDFRRNGWTFGPVASLQCSYMTTPAYTESDPAGLNLHVDRQNQNSLASSLGAHINYAIPVAAGFTVVPEIRCVWNHEFYNTPRTLTGNVPIIRNFSFDYTDNVIPANAVSPSAGVTFLFGRNLSAGIFYNASLWTNSAVQSVALNGVITF